MYVILTQEVPKLGQKNALVNVARGYYSNYLHPRGFANRATADMIERLKEKILNQKVAAEAVAQGINEDARVLNNSLIVLAAKASKKGTLFKAIAEKTIAIDIEKEYKIKVDPKAIVMKHIKSIGEHSIKINLGDEVVGMKVIINLKEE